MGNANTESEVENFAVRIFTDFQKELPRQIAFNYDELKKSLEEAISPFRGLVLEETTDNIKFAKGNRAKINKLATMINNARIATKEKYLEPYMEFEQKCNSLMHECRLTSGELDEFVKNYEAKIKEKKVKFAHDYLLERLDSEFADCTEARESHHWGEFESSHTKWQNLTYSENEIKADIDTEIDKAKNAIATVKTIYGQMSAEAIERALIDIYLHFDVNKTATAVNGWIKQQEHIRLAVEERKRKEEEQKRLENERMEAAKSALEAKRQAKIAQDNEITTYDGVPSVGGDNDTKKDGSESGAVLGTNNGSVQYRLNFHGSPEVIWAVIDKIEGLGILCNDATLNMIAPIEVFKLFRKEIDAIDGLNYHKS